MNRRIALSSLIAGTATAVSAPVVFGAADWCEDDPLVVIKTPTGYQLPVHVTNYALGNHKGALQIVHNNPLPPYITYTVDPIAPKGGGADGKQKDERKDKREDRKDDRKDKKPAAPLTAPQSWNVSIWVLIPGHAVPGDAVEGRFMTRTVASTGENATGKILARDAGFSDDLMELKFTITA